MDGVIGVGTEEETRDHNRASMVLPSTMRDNPVTQLFAVHRDVIEVFQGIYNDPTDSCITYLSQEPYEKQEFSQFDFKDIILNQSITTKIRPVLLSFSGLPESGKTKALSHLLQNFVYKSPFKPMKEPDTCLGAEGIKYYELVATGFHKILNLIMTQVTKESSCAFGLMSAFKKSLIENKMWPILTDINHHQIFLDAELNDHLNLIFNSLKPTDSNKRGDESDDDSDQKYACSCLADEEQKFAEFIKKYLPDGIALINIWDLAINRIALHFLTALRGHLYNCHMWLFLDLEKDLDKLDLPPEIPKGKHERDEGVLMKWRPRLHYLIRSCRMSESRERERKRACTLFAFHSGAFNGELQEKVDELELQVQQVAKQVGVSSLLEEKVETMNLKGPGNIDDYSLRLYHKFEHLICEKPYKDIPFSWVFLRSVFYCHKDVFITKADLKEIAFECGINETSLSQFCKFYTSFGSIFDLSLICPDYGYVIVKPMGFLQSLDKFFPSKSQDATASWWYIPLKYGIVPEKAFRAEFGQDASAYIDALVCLNLAIKISYKNLQLDHDELAKHIPQNDTLYYIPLSRITKTETKPDPTSVHLVTSIDVPHNFKQTTFVRELLNLLPKLKLVPCTETNETIVKDEATDTVVTLVSYTPATKIHINKPNNEICSAIVKAYEQIAKGYTTKYKFIVICGDVKDVQSIPSCKYHILPDDDLCRECIQAGRLNEMLMSWNTALKENPIPQQHVAIRHLRPSELSLVAEKIASYDIDVIAKVFELDDYKSEPRFEGFDGAKLVNELLLVWDKKLKHSTDDRCHILALKLNELGKALKLSNEKEKEDLKTLVKEIDIHGKIEF
jgi:hypothetical protein